MLDLLSLLEFLNCTPRVWSALENSLGSLLYSLVTSLPLLIGTGTAASSVVTADRSNHNLLLLQEGISSILELCTEHCGSFLRLCVHAAHFYAMTTKKITSIVDTELSTGVEEIDGGVEEERGERREEGSAGYELGDWGIGKFRNMLL